MMKLFKDKLLSGQKDKIAPHSVGFEITISFTRHVHYRCATMTTPPIGVYISTPIVYWVAKTVICIQLEILGT